MQSEKKQRQPSAQQTANPAVKQAAQQPRTKEEALQQMASANPEMMAAILRDILNNRK